MLKLSKMLCSRLKSLVYENITDLGPSPNSVIMMMKFCISMCRVLVEQLCDMERSTALGHRKGSEIAGHPSVCVCGHNRLWYAVWVRWELGGCWRDWIVS